MLPVFKKLEKRVRMVLGTDARLISTVRPYTMLSPGKLTNLRELAEWVNLQKIEGDFVECGTYKGGSAAILGSQLTASRHLWLYDSYQGMPPVEEIDGEGAKEWVGKCVGRIEDVVEVLTLVGLSKAQYTIRAGWFHKTFKTPLSSRVALLHCDADWYESVLSVLKTFYPLVPEGGIVVLDDFGCWEGCREAFYDFCSGYGEKPLIERFEYDQAYWVKGKKHNRDG